MTFWPRLACALMCWFLTMLVIWAVVNHYVIPMPTTGLLDAIIRVLVAGVSILTAVVSTLAFWLWVWIRD